VLDWLGGEVSELKKRRQHAGHEPRVASGAGSGGQSGKDLLQHGVDRTVIALWLGHESTETVDIYLHANLDMKEKALAKTASTDIRRGRYHPDDEVLAFLQSL